MSDPPVGLAFLDLLARQEQECEVNTRARREKLGQKAPKCLSEFGTVLSLLDRLATCAWGCRGGEHEIERLVGRAVGSARASLRLMHGGYYDESLAITRGIGEVANLLSLFAADSAAHATWKGASDRERRNGFAPVAVRRKVEELGAPLPVTAERYALLCEIGTHVTPRTLPQGHNPLGMPSLGANFQEAGYLLCLNELVLPVAFVAIFGARLLKPSKEAVADLKRTSRAMIEAMGGVNLTDGVPRLKGEVIREIAEMVATLPVEEQQAARALLLQMGGAGGDDST